MQVIRHPRDVPGHVPASGSCNTQGRAAHAQRQAQPQAQRGQDGEEHGTALPRRHPSRQNGRSLVFSLPEGRGPLGHRGCALPKLPWAVVPASGAGRGVSAVRRARREQRQPAAALPGKPALTIPVLGPAATGAANPGHCRTYLIPTLPLTWARNAPLAAAGSARAPHRPPHPQPSLAEAVTSSPPGRNPGLESCIPPKVPPF